MNSLSSSFLFVSALLFSSGMTTASEPQVFDRTLPVAGPLVLEISTGHGGVKIIKGSQNSVRVHAVVRPLYGRLDLGLAEESIRSLQRNPPIEQTESHIRIGFTQLEKLRNVSMTVEVEVPLATEIRAQTTAGGIAVNGPSGPVVATTVSGHIEIADVAGSVSATSGSGGVQVASVRGGLDLRSQSGRIEVNDVSGDVHAITHTGSISVGNATGSVIAKNTSGSIDAFQLGGAVQAETKSGAIRIAQIKPAPIRAFAESGAIKVDLASQQGYTIDAQSRSGKVLGSLTKSAGRLADVHQFKHVLAGGGPLVDLDTRSSKIEIN